MHLTISTSSTEPIYRQIVEQVRRQIVSGQLRAGGEISSVRALAQLHAINPMTVSKAYSLLESEGFLTRRRGVGMVVAPIQAATRVGQLLDLLEPALIAAAQQAQQLGLAHDEALHLFERCLLEHAPRLRGRKTIGVAR